ncbi:hypothetical protein B0T21DRAFT_422329 [Apiosordaria backusii]|uniref:Uncharacterized protein n=1 Tax=Apiosordaria backusii TaxID=314023 RepID=A0AA40B2P0_9PEZI|nr:hypothetical protein B0T21DRAFT_422329 [Apiosordaria backusii]
MGAYYSRFSQPARPVLFSSSSQQHHHPHCSIDCDNNRLQSNIRPQYKATPLSWTFNTYFIYIQRQSPSNRDFVSSLASTTLSSPNYTVLDHSVVDNRLAKCQLQRCVGCEEKYTSKDSLSDMFNLERRRPFWRRLADPAKMATQSSRLVSLMGVTLALDNVLDQCTMTDIETLNYTCRHLHSYISDYLLRRARRNLSPEGLKAAITMVHLCQHAKYLAMYMYERRDPLLSELEEKAIIDIIKGTNTANISSLTTSRWWFDICRIEEMTAIFIRHVLRVQRQLADMSKCGLADTSHCDESGLYSFIQSHAESLIATVGEGRRPLSKAEIARMERSFIRAETLLLLKAVFPVAASGASIRLTRSPAVASTRYGSCVSTRLTKAFFQSPNDWEVEEALTALDFFQGGPLEKHHEHSHNMILLYERFRRRLPQAYYRQFYSGLQHHKEEAWVNDGVIVIANPRDEVGTDLPPGGNIHDKSKINCPNHAWSAYSRHFPLRPLSDGSIVSDDDEPTISKPSLVMVGTDPWTQCHPIDMHRRFGWVFWDRDTIEALKLDDVSENGMSLLVQNVAETNLEEDVVIFHSLPSS